MADASTPALDPQSLISERLFSSAHFDIEAIRVLADDIEAGDARDERILAGAITALTERLSRTVSEIGTSLLVGQEA